MITKLIITKLFGRFDYEIMFKDGGITILTGPNGFGKSTILKIIYEASNGNLNYFAKLNFSKLEIHSKTQLVIFKKKKNQLFIDGEILNQKSLKRECESKSWVNKKYEYIFNYIDNNIANSEILKLNDLENSYFDMCFDEDSSKLKRISSKLKKLCGNVRLITEQRLIKEVDQNNPKDLRHNEQKMRHVINELPNDLKNEISAVTESYSKFSNKLDSTYPNRLFLASQGIKNTDELDKNLILTYYKFNQLSKYSLIDNVNLPFEDIQYRSELNIAFKLYFDDFSAKYKIFEPLITKLELFTDIINNRLTFKEIIITSDGFKVVDIDNRKQIELNQLSSGEKQEIVLFYDLIFNTTTDLLLLIDEPEISLHIAWQKKFLDDLIKVSKDVSLKAVIATHSPQIISNHWDIQIDLGALYGCKFN